MKDLLYFVGRFLHHPLLHTTAITAKVMATTRNNKPPIIPPISVLDRPNPSSETESSYTVKIRKIQTPKKIVIIILKFEQCGFIIHVCIQKM